MAATALVALVLVMAVATAGFAVLMGVLVVMAVAAHVASPVCASVPAMSASTQASQLSWAPA